MTDRQVHRIQGRPIPLRGNDIDTDRIIPARYLKAITFDGLEAGVFEDDRAQLADRGQVHAFSDPRFAGASVLIVNRNFGCGSSREHAPQALQRWGITAVVGESFSEIFFGNSVALGLPCVTLETAAIEALQAAADTAPAGAVTVDLESMRVVAAEQRYVASMPASARQALLAGTWDATGLLMEDAQQIRDVATSLPYVAGFTG